MLSLDGLEASVCMGHHSQNLLFESIPHCHLSMAHRSQNPTLQTLSTAECRCSFTAARLSPRNGVLVAVHVWSFGSTMALGL